MLVCFMNKSKLVVATKVVLFKIQSCHYMQVREDFNLPLDSLPSLHKMQKRAILGKTYTDLLRFEAQVIFPILIPHIPKLLVKPHVFLNPTLAFTYIFYFLYYFIHIIYTMLMVSSLKHLYIFFLQHLRILSVLHHAQKIIV